MLSFRKTLTQTEVQKEMNDIDSFIKENELTIVGPKISTTYSITQAIVPTMDIEILIPVVRNLMKLICTSLKEHLNLQTA